MANTARRLNSSDRASRAWANATKAQRNNEIKSARKNLGWDVFSIVASGASSLVTGPVGATICLMSCFKLLDDSMLACHRLK